MGETKKSTMMLVCVYTLSVIALLFEMMMPLFTVKDKTQGVLTISNMKRQCII